MKRISLLLLRSIKPHTQQKCRGTNKKVLLGKVVKEQVGELEDEDREVFSRQMRNYLTVLVESVSGNRGFLVGF